MIRRIPARANNHQNWENEKANAYALIRNISYGEKISKVDTKNALIATEMKYALINEDLSVHGKNRFVIRKKMKGEHKAIEQEINNVVLPN